MKQLINQKTKYKPLKFHKMNLKINLTVIKNSIKVSKHTNNPETFSASISNKERDIKIKVTCFTQKDIKQDIYPYFTIEMEEEEFCKTLFLADIKEVRDVYNAFISQGNESYLLTL